MGDLENPLLLVFCGEGYEGKEEPTDNAHARVDNSKPLNEYADAISSALGVASLDEVELFQGTGKLPSATQGTAVDLAKNATEQGFVPPDLAEGEEPLCIIYVKKKEEEKKEEGEEEKKEEGAADGAENTEDAAAADGPQTPACNAEEVAETIFKAIDGLGTDEDAIFKSAETLGGQGDWNRVKDAFRAAHPTCNDGDIVQAIKEDLNKPEMEKLMAQLQQKGISLEGGDEGAAADSPGEGTGDANGGGGGMCADCNNELTQPFCGVTGRPHVQNNPAANADSKPFSSEQFSSDRACTQCGDGMLEDEAQQAVYVCLDCDAKLCEVCWDHEHRNKKRSGHAQHILYFDCDLCPFGDNPSSPRPALWFCDVCRLLLCKQCWFNEHKNRGRRSHQSQFLYPGGESGPHAASTIDAQTLEVPAGNFDITPFGGFVKDPSERICTICNGAEGSAAYFCIECDLHNPERLCGNCWATEHRMPHRRGHVKKVMMYECDVCLDHEHRAASVICRTCNLKLCRQCLDIEHRNPQRHGHATETLYNDIQDPEARRLIDTVAIVGDGIPSQQTALLPAHPSPGVGAVYPTDLALVNYPFMPAHLVSASPPRILTPQGGAASPPLFHMSPSRFDSPVYTAQSASVRAEMTSEELKTFMHYRHRLARFYQVYNPQKLPAVVSTLREYEGFEEDLMAALIRRYGPEPLGAEPALPFGWRLVESTRGDLFYMNSDGRKQWQRPVA